jgi:hypothetical protein
MTVSSDPVATFASAVGSFAALVRDIPADRWDGPGLGEWDLRSLVGHTSRSLITVSTYLQQPAEREDITTPQEYYAKVIPLRSVSRRPASSSAAGRPAETWETTRLRRSTRWFRVCWASCLAAVTH